MAKAPGILIGIGVVLLIATYVLGWLTIPKVFQGKIKEKVQLRNGTQTWERWTNVTTPVFLRIYIFNTTNPEEVAEGGKPKLEEFGPYVYQQKRLKVDLRLSENDTKVAYKQQIRHFFRPDLSNGTEQDRFTILNIPLLSLTSKGSELGFFAQIVLTGIIEEHPEEKLFMDITVGELLFKGKFVPLMKTLEDTTGQSAMKNHTFGLFYPKNESLTEELEVYTGVGDPSKFGLVASWDNKTELNFWTEDHCNKINGSDGSLFAPFVQRDRVLQLFSPEMCRSLYLIYSKDIDVNGIPGYRFSVPKEMLDASDENSCYCVNPGLNNKNCPKGGAMDLSVCRNGAPVMMSTAHFLDGSDEYINGVEGIRPDPALHSTIIDLEPNTGLILNVRKRMQLNFVLRPNTLSTEFSNVREVVYPIIWVDEGASMPKATQEAIKGMIIKPLEYVDVGKWVLVGVGAVLVAIGFLMVMLNRRPDKEYTLARTDDVRNGGVRS